MSEDFDLEILGRAGSYLIVSRAFGVAVRNSDMEAGIKEALKRIAEVRELYLEAGLEPQLSGDWPPRRARNFLRGRETVRDDAQSLKDYIPPALVSGVILAGFVLLSTVPLISVLAHFNRTLEEASTVTSNAMIHNLGRSAVDMIVKTGNAMDMVTPQRKQEVRLAVRKIMNGLAPIIEEVGDSREPDAPTPPPAR
jgi:hypothetical protein